MFYNSTLNHIIAENQDTYMYVMLLFIYLFISGNKQHMSVTMAMLTEISTICPGTRCHETIQSAVIKGRIHVANQHKCHKNSSPSVRSRAHCLIYAEQKDQ